MNRYWQILILVVVAVAVIFLVPKKQEPEVVATDFESCQAAGGSVTTGAHTTCTMPDGSTFEDEDSEVIPEPEVVVDTPEYGALVKSPLTVSGRAKGFWFFEANIPVTLKDQTGKILAQKGFMATEEWMTEDYVDFTGTLEFAAPTTEFGVLIINKDNPSGDPERDASYAIPVRFK